MFMWYCGGGIGHVGTGSNHDSSDVWMDVDDENEDIELHPQLAVVDREDTDDEHSEDSDEGSEIEDEEDLGPEDGEGDDELEEDYDSL